MWPCIMLPFSCTELLQAGAVFSVLSSVVKQPLNLFGSFHPLASLHEGIMLPFTAKLLRVLQEGLLGCTSTD